MGGAQCRMWWAARRAESGILLAVARFNEIGQPIGDDLASWEPPGMIPHVVSKATARD